MSADLFHIRAKLDWAESQFPFILAKFELFLKSKPYTVWTEEDADAGWSVAKMRYDKPFPHDIAIDNGNVLYQIRSALAQLTSVLAVRNGATNTKGTSFPICSTREAYFNVGKVSGRKKVTKLSVRDQERIEELQPYNTGDNRLLSLNSLGVIDKHNRPLAASAVIASLGIIRGVGDFHVETQTWARLNNESVLMRVSPGSKVEFNTTFTVGFKEIGNDDRKSFVRTMRDTLHAARECVENFS